MCSDDAEDSNDPLILATRDAITSTEEMQNLAKTPAHLRALQNTTHIEALSAALHMARSHHALGVEEARAGTMTAACRRHLYAFELIGKTQCLRAAFKVSPLGRKLPSPSLRERRSATRHRDLSVVSRDCKTHMYF